MNHNHYTYTYNPAWGSGHSSRMFPQTFSLATFSLTLPLNIPFLDKFPQNTSPRTLTWTLQPRQIPHTFPPFPISVHIPASCLLHFKISLIQDCLLIEGRPPVNSAKTIHRHAVFTRSVCGLKMWNPHTQLAGYRSAKSMSYLHAICHADRWWHAVMRVCRLACRQVASTLNNSNRLPITAVAVMLSVKSGVAEWHFTPVMLTLTLVYKLDVYPLKMNGQGATKTWPLWLVIMA